MRAVMHHTGETKMPPYMTMSDVRYYARERRKEARRQYRRDFLNNRQKAAEKWKEIHPEGITRENLKEYQAFMRKADNDFKTSA
jgi:hypothetical protein